jgi:hypothetical protein
MIVGVPDLRPVFTDSTAEATQPGLRMVAVPAPPRLRLDADTVRALFRSLGAAGPVDNARHALPLLAGWTGQAARAVP